MTSEKKDKKISPLFYLLFAPLSSFWYWFGVHHLSVSAVHTHPPQCTKHPQGPKGFTASTASSLQMAPSKQFGPIT